MVAAISKNKRTQMLFSLTPDNRPIAAFSVLVKLGQGVEAPVDDIGIDVSVGGTIGFVVGEGTSLPPGATATKSNLSLLL